jgi:hypothetical protein
VEVIREHRRSFFVPSAANLPLRVSVEKRGRVLVWKRAIGATRSAAPLWLSVALLT